jgi:hypothetical protein
MAGAFGTTKALSYHEVSSTITPKTEMKVKCEPSQMRTTMNSLSAGEGRGALPFS